jgi:starch phosphorylase
VAVGLLYRNGYFQQYLTADGWQQEAYPELDFYNLAIEPLRNLPTARRCRCGWICRTTPVFCKVWKANRRAHSAVSARHQSAGKRAGRPRHHQRLYGGGTEMRIKQEIVLGIGGVRALEALNVSPTVFHMNEGHSAFLALERVRVLLEHSPLTFDRGAAAGDGHQRLHHAHAGAGGHRSFPPDLMVKYFQAIISRT